MEISASSQRLRSMPRSDFLNDAWSVRDAVPIWRRIWSWLYRMNHNWTYPLNVPNRDERERRERRNEGRTVKSGLRMCAHCLQSHQSLRPTLTMPHCTLKHSCELTLHPSSRRHKILQMRRKCLNTNGYGEM